METWIAGGPNRAAAPATSFACSSQGFAGLEVGIEQLYMLRRVLLYRSRPRSQQRAQWPAGADGADGADGTDSPPGTLQQQQQQQRANKPLLAVPVLTV